MERFSSTVHIDAPPERVWDEVADVTRTGRWSPVCYRVEWKAGWDSPVVGARFRGHNKLRGVRWVRECEVTAADRPRRFGFRTFLKGKESTRWLYEFEPEDGGTRVTESYEPIRAPLYVRLIRLVADARLDADIKQNVETSLRRLKATVEAT